MPISSKDIKAVLNRVHGYGSENPTYIFIGMEEATQDPKNELE